MQWLSSIDYTTDLLQFA